MDPIEIAHPDFPRGQFRAAIFDFDGTLSLIRAGWMQIMIPMMVDVLRQTGTAETDAQLTDLVGDFVMRFNGRPTIHQMDQLTEEIRQRGGHPAPSETYRARFLDLLMRRVGERTGAILSGQAPREQWAIPGAHAFLQQLHDRGLHLYLASGTEITHVRREAELLGFTRFFDLHLYGPRGDGDGFTKRAVIDQILADHDLHGAQLLAFGDGVVEIEETKKVGGVAIAVASREDGQSGIDPWKRDRLLRAGADIVIPDYQAGDRLLEVLF